MREPSRSKQPVAIRRRPNAENLPWTNTLSPTFRASIHQVDTFNYYYTVKAVGHLIAITQPPKSHIIFPELTAEN